MPSERGGRPSRGFVTEETRALLVPASALRSSAPGCFLFSLVGVTSFPLSLVECLFAAAPLWEKGSGFSKNDISRKCPHLPDILDRHGPRNVSDNPRQNLTPSLRRRKKYDFWCTHMSLSVEQVPFTNTELTPTPLHITRANRRAVSAAAGGGSGGDHALSSAGRQASGGNPAYPARDDGGGDGDRGGVGGLLRPRPRGGAPAEPTTPVPVGR